HVNPADPHGQQGNNSDDDGNGFRDDYVGWDFYNGDAYPIDDHGHGTHVAGLAAGTYGGVAPKAKILPVKVLGKTGRGDLATIAAGILYAIDMGADIINLSLGGPAAGQASADINQLLSAVVKAKNHNALLVAAAGNGGQDGVGDCNDANPIYPASFDQKNIVSVASVDRYNNLTAYSNFGSQSVHVAAPGGDQYSGGLLSLGVPNCYGPCDQSEQRYVSMAGTSMAAPLVAGVAALIKSAKPGLNHRQIRSVILAQGTSFEALADRVQSSKVVNAAMAVQAAFGL
ncbi:MAG: S8 family serine peptidase, partial [Bacteriovoracaceae bacterium]